MNDAWFIVWIACFTSAVVVVVGAIILVRDWYDYRTTQMRQALDRSRQALMDMPPITVRIGTPLYDWEQEDVS